jgi:hypothetical protein
MFGLASYLLFMTLLALVMRLASLGGRRDRSNAVAAMLAARVL